MVSCVSIYVTLFWVLSLTYSAHQRFAAKQYGTFYFRTGILTQLLACESIRCCKVKDKIYTDSDLLDQNMLFFPIRLFWDKWFLLVVVALPNFGTKGPKVPMLYYFDPSGSYANDADVLDMGNRIRILLNIFWCQQFRPKVDKINNPFNKRSLPLKCFEGEEILIQFFWEFFKFHKISWNSQLVLNHPVHLGILVTLMLNHIVGIFQNLKNILKSKCRCCSMVIFLTIPVLSVWRHHNH